LYLLCGPLLGGLDALPGPQAEALRTAFGLSGGRPRAGSWSGWLCWEMKSRAEIVREALRDGISP
jgi:hypothetical protein